MKLSDSVKEINEMSFKLFKELLLNTSEDSVEKSINTCNEVMEIASNQRPSDNRGFMKSVLNRDYLMICINKNLPILTSKMVSLSILFANPTDEPDYFDKLCRDYSIDYNKLNEDENLLALQKIAYDYSTTPDNVKSNILFNEYKKYFEKQNNQTKRK